MPVLEKPRQSEAASWWWAGFWLLSIYISIPLARTVQQAVDGAGLRMAFLWVTILFFLVGALWVLKALIRKEIILTPLRSIILVAILGTFSSLTWSLRTNPEEAFHFVQYGVLSILLFRALSHRLTDPSIYLAAAAIGAIGGILDEMIQWITPRRYFDYRDIAINALAGTLIQTALAFGVKPGRIRGTFNPAGLRIFLKATAICMSLLFICLANTPRVKHAYTRFLPFMQQVPGATAEYGHLIENPEAGLIFFSRLSPEELQREDATRGAEAADRLEPTRSKGAYEQFLAEVPAYRDPYLVEARVHLFRRDRYAGSMRNPDMDEEEKARHAFIASRENRILETYFSNLMANSTFRWSPERTRDLETRGARNETYISPVSQYLITRFPPWLLPGAAALLAAGCLLAAHRLKSSSWQDKHD
jgi:VanZ family protein